MCHSLCLLRYTGNPVFVRGMVPICTSIFMAALCNRAGHYIFALWFLSSSSSSSSSIFFPRLIAAAADWMSTILPLMVWPSANFECRSEMCCTRLAGNTGRKNRHFGTIAQLCRPISSELSHVSTIGKKLVKQQYLLHMS